MLKEFRVIIIDRNLTSRRALYRLMLAAGFYVQTFEYACDFLKTAENVPLGGLIVDLDEFDIDIQQFKQRLNDSQWNLKIFVISSEDSEEVRANASSLGAVGFFRKPVDGKALIDSINWVMSR